MTPRPQVQNCQFFTTPLSRIYQKRLEHKENHPKYRNYEQKRPRSQLKVFNISNVGKSGLLSLSCFHMRDFDVITSPSIGQLQLSSRPLKLGYLNSILGVLFDPTSQNDYTRLPHLLVMGEDFLTGKNKHISVYAQNFFSDLKK